MVDVFSNVNVDVVLKSYGADGVNLLPEVLRGEGNFRKAVNRGAIGR